MRARRVREAARPDHLCIVAARRHARGPGQARGGGGVGWTGQDCVCSDGGGGGGERLRAGVEALGVRHRQERARALAVGGQPRRPTASVGRDMAGSWVGRRQ